MNTPRNNSSNTSPGFVYFNPDFQKSPRDTQDFLSFQDSSNTNYSNSYDRNSPNNYGSPKFHSSPRKFNHRGNPRYSGGGRGNRSFYSPNNSFNNSWSNQRSPQQHYNHKNKFNNTPMKSKDGSRDMSMFFDPTSTENPWEQLEKQLEMDKASEQIETKKPSVNKTEDGGDKKEVQEENEESSSSSSEEEESDSSNSGDGNDKEETP